MKSVTALVISSFVHIIFVHNGQAFKGINMCQRDCELTKGCTGIYYDLGHLKCRLLFDLEKSDEAKAPAVTTQIVKTSFTADALKTCSTRDRLVVTRMGKDVCIQTEVVPARQEYYRLLIAGSKWYQLELKTQAVHRINLHAPLMHVMCVTYLKIANRFVVSYRNGLFTTSLTAMKTTRLKRHTWVVGIAVDEAKKVIFILVFNKWTTRTYRICTMNLKGFNLRCFTAQSRAGLFAVDTNHKRVFAYSKNKIPSYTYNGTLILEYGQIIRCSSAMVYDSDTDVLYCSFGPWLTVITNTGKETRVHEFKQFGSVRDMKIQSPYLYVSSSGKTDALFVVDVENRFKVKKIKLTEDKVGYRLCLF